MRIDIKQLKFIDKTLRNICVWLEKETGLEFTITSLYRIDDPGVHGTLPLRAVDLRIRDQTLGKVIKGMVNCEWIYDPTRPRKKCAVAHGKGRNYHIHLQSHPNTSRIL